MNAPEHGTPDRQRRWRATRRLTAWLLLAWFVITFGIAFFARELSFTIFGWPFSFWVASQGALIVYCAIIWFYARRMDKLDQEAEDTER